jgi:menaquinone-dependent protoporphyrinogen oxidase
MSARILVAYATKHGSTQEVAEAIAETLRSHELDVNVRSAKEVRDVCGYAAVVVGGSLYTGKWHRDALSFLRRHARALADEPVAVFAMGPQTLDESDVVGSRKQLDASLAKVPAVIPSTIAIFGGVVDPAKLRFPFNRMPASDARDWDAIRRWGRDLAALFEHGAAA